MDIEDIKKEVLNRIKSIQKYKRIPEKKIIQWINEIPAIDFNPYTIILILIYGGIFWW